MRERYVFARVSESRMTSMREKITDNRSEIYKYTHANIADSTQ